MWTPAKKKSQQSHINCLESPWDADKFDPRWKATKITDTHGRWNKTRPESTRTTNKTANLHGTLIEKSIIIHPAFFWTTRGRNPCYDGGALFLVSSKSIQSTLTKLITTSDKKHRSKHNEALWSRRLRGESAESGNLTLAKTLKKNKRNTNILLLPQLPVKLINCGIRV